MSEQRRARVVVLISGSGTLLQALLDAAAAPGAPYRVVAVLADREGIAGLERARAAGVPTATVQVRDFDDRAQWDLAVAKAVAVFAPDLVVAAGFMKILGPGYLERFGPITINSHPALLPAFPGAHGVRDALAYGVKVTGCSVILIDGGVDAGPIVAQRAVPVLDDDTEASLHERIKVAEWGLLVEAVRRMTTGGWTLEGRTVRLGPAEPAEPAEAAEGGPNRVG